MKTAQSVKAKNLRSGDRVIVWEEGFTVTLAVIQRVDDPYYGSSGYTVTFSDGSTESYAPRDRVVVLR